MSETLLRRLTDRGITAFSNQEFRRVSRLSPARAQARLQGLVRKGVLRRFLHGWYLVHGPAESEVLREPMFLGTRLVQPSYVAFGSALRFYDWTKRMSPVTFIASPRRSRIERIGAHPIRVQQLPRSRFFGYATVRRGRLEFAVAEPEKAIVDAFYRPRLCGGLQAVVDAVGRARASLDIERLEAYAVRMHVRTLCSRLGYVLETLGEEPRSLRRNVSTVPVKLDPRGPRRGHLVPRWQVIENL